MAWRQRWDVQFTRQAAEWYRSLAPRDAAKVAGHLEKLQHRGPGLGRPFVDHVKSSRHHNMKELRLPGGSLRVLFAFDPNRRAIMLAGGDKTDNWKGWYREYVPKADRLYDQHLRNLGGGSSPSPRHTRGRKSGGRDR